jgi:hypothetical protein
VLLDPEPGERDGEQLLNLAFRILSHDIVYNILRYMAGRHKQAFSGFVEPLVARLMAQSNGGLFDVISSYCGNDRGRLTSWPPVSSRRPRREQERSVPSSDVY